MEVALYKIVNEATIRHTLTREQVRRYPVHFKPSPATQMATQKEKCGTGIKNPPSTQNDLSHSSTHEHTDLFICLILLRRIERKICTTPTKESLDFFLSLSGT